MKNKFSLVYYTIDQRLILEYLLDEGKRAGTVELPQDMSFREVLRTASMYSSLHTASINVLVVGHSSLIAQPEHDPLAMVKDSVDAAISERAKEPDPRSVISSSTISFDDEDYRPADGI